ncbi:MAG TPA: PIN domain-containing protein [Rhodoferax sp.]|jgi:hypothetical protein|nr:PIN domain-containing protein [Rhodoferax sp.]HOF50896.1 PIN domain-containing protein [Rhodoferax sp.]HQC85103.1 PIN domain-containing protein [Rhodoferax sp.]
MRTQVILVDWENVQPELLPALDVDETKLVVFIGPHQTKLPFAMVEAVQKFGDRAEYVKVSKQGKDALDMHIAFHIGRMSTQLDDAYFHVISKDGDYDPLIAHLKEKFGIFAARWSTLNAIPVIRRAQAKTPKDQLEVTREWLIERKAGRPKTLKTLSNSLKTSVFVGRLTDEEIESLLVALQANNWIKILGQKVSYAEALDA